MANAILLRDMLHDDLGIFFIQQLDREANWMAAFTKENPADRAAFNEHWRRINSRSFHPDEDHRLQQPGRRICVEIHG